MSFVVRPEYFEAVKGLGIDFPLGSACLAIETIGKYVLQGAEFRQLFIDCYKFTKGKKVYRIKNATTYGEFKALPKPCVIKYIVGPPISEPEKSLGEIQLFAYLYQKANKRCERLSNVRFTNAPLVNGNYKSVWESFLDSQAKKMRRKC